MLNLPVISTPIKNLFVWSDKFLNGGNLFTAPFNWIFKKIQFFENCRREFHLCRREIHYTMGVYSIRTIMSFPLGLCSVGAKNYAFCIGSKFKRWAKFKFLSFSISHMLYLKAITRGCYLKYVLFKTRQSRHTE